MNWKNAVVVNASAAPAAPAVSGDNAVAQQLLAAAKLFDARTDDFAAGKGATCRDIAARVAASGFASDKQREFAVKLITWSQPRAATPVDADTTVVLAQLRAAGAAYAAAGNAYKASTALDIAAKLERFGRFASEAQQGFALALVRESPADVAVDGPVFPAAPSRVPLVPKLFEVMQQHATLHAGDLKISRKNGDTMCWLVWGDRPVGKLQDGRATVWFGKAGTHSDAILALLAEFEADPLGAAMKYGKLSGRCCSCGRDLTDPVSIERGIGPICAGRFA